MAEKQTNPFDSDLETARMRLRNLAEDACSVLDARMLNLASFHLCAYMDFATGRKEHLVKIMMREIEAEHLSAAGRGEKTGASPKTLTKPRRMRKSEGER